jgi:hypothetical protein
MSSSHQTHGHADRALRLLDDSLRRLAPTVDLWQMHDLRDERDRRHKKGGALRRRRR